MQRIHQVGGEHEDSSLDLDEIARAGARRMLAEALEAEVEPTSRRPENSATSKDAPWSFATATPESVRSSWEPEPWRFKAPRVNDK